jgi:Xaa-Pro aminopeptidase
MVGPDDLRQTGASTASQALARVVESGSQGDAELEIRRKNALVNQMRAVKSPAELELIRRAVEITEAAHRALLGAIRPGITEADLKVVIDSVFRAMGADERPAFGHIVASAENSTILHYRGGDRVLGEDEHVKIDIGAAYHGYAADVTRTYPVNGTFSPELRAIYQVVRDAQARAEAMAAEGAAEAPCRRRRTRSWPGGWRARAHRSAGRHLRLRAARGAREWESARSSAFSTSTPWGTGSG